MKRLLTFLLITFLLISGSIAQNGAAKLPRGRVSPQWSKAAENFCKETRTVDTPDIAIPYSIMVVDHGNVVFEQWYEGYTAESLFNVYSVSKTILALAVGCAVDEGRFSLDDKVIDFFPNQLPQHVSDTLSAMTIRHLLTMTCGLQESPKLLSVFSGNTDFDWIAEFFNSPQTSLPGTTFYYNFFSPYILAAIVEKNTEMNVVDYIRPRLLEPMQITDLQWGNSPAGICLGAWGAELCTEDMAKIGLLLLQKGKWNGQQLVPSKWVETMTSKQVESKPLCAFLLNMPPEFFNDPNNDHAQGYGYYVWMGKYGTIRAEGLDGRHIIMNPKKDVVFVITSHTNMDQKFIDLIYKHFESLL